MSTPQTLPPIQCRCFALCTNVADGFIAHPILTAVPACTRCGERLEGRWLPWSLDEDGESITVGVAEEVNT